MWMICDDERKRKVVTWPFGSNTGVSSHSSYTRKKKYKAMKIKGNTTK
jgi:hypothetical protein